MARKPTTNDQRPKMGTRRKSRELALQMLFQDMEIITEEAGSKSFVV